MAGFAAQNRPLKIKTALFSEILQSKLPKK
jgi:hypothetical protein